MNLLTLLPRQFRPNRRIESPDRTAEASRPVLEACRAELRGAITRNLDAVLTGQPPQAVIGPACSALMPGGDPLAGYSLDDYRGGILPSPEFAGRIMAGPDLMTRLAHPSSAIGAATLLTGLMTDTLRDGALRHALAERCRQFLSEHVLFHPGPPPAPQFSAAGLTVLVWSQPVQMSALALVKRDFMSSCLATLSSVPESFGLWDQWLLRRIAETPGWSLPAALTSLRWVAWRPGEPVDPPQPGQPAYWPNLLSLEP